jgi:sugar phosphate permease
MNFHFFTKYMLISIDLVVVVFPHAAGEVGGFVVLAFRCGASCSKCHSAADAWGWPLTFR